MKFSWNYKNFFKINKKIGKNEVVDFILYFTSSWLIYFILAVVLMWGYFKYDNSVNFWFFFLVLGVSVVVGLFSSYIIALIWPRRRPVAVLKNIKQLITPFQTWKSFPSDHTLLSFIFSLTPLYFGAGFAFVLALFFLSAMVGYGRVYVGVHYPYDIFGGFFLALLVSPISFWLILTLVF
jgi:undecaprenyl-diphosphatase